MSSRRLSPGVLALLVVLGALGLGSAAVGVVVAWDAGTTTSDRPGPGAAPSPRSSGAASAAGREDRSLPSGSSGSSAREVLRAWDRRREAAWRDVDVDALAELYLPNAVAGRRDVVLLREWSERGARVVRLQPQVLALRVVRQTERLLVLRVTDRVGVVEAEVGGETIMLPRDQPTTRRIELRRGPSPESPWRVASVITVSR